MQLMDDGKDEKSTITKLVIEAHEAVLAMLRFPLAMEKRELQKEFALALYQHRATTGHLARL